jgi:hypothetical protein
MVTLASHAVTNALGADQTSGNIEALILEALDAGGYSDRSTWLVPGGFAVVARLERIGLDGAPVAEPDRWPLSDNSVSRFDLRRFVVGLFYAQPGYFRVIVFVVSDEAFTQTDRSATRNQALEWLRRGANRLPREYAERRFTPLHAITALIYEFARDNASEEPRLLTPGRLSGRKHLEMAGLYATLFGRGVDEK